MINNLSALPPSKIVMFCRYHSVCLGFFDDFFRMYVQIVTYSFYTVVLTYLGLANIFY